MGTWIAIADEATAVGEGEVNPYDAAGLPVALFRVHGKLFALHDLCSHGAARLSDGFVDEACIECPLHQGLVEIATGAPMSPPITEAIRSLPVRVVDGRVEVEV
ncbi:MAG: non-heme iron oxygenase ferredoxin subunit [Caulobacteraceae bacterium]